MLQTATGSIATQNISLRASINFHKRNSNKNYVHQAVMSLDNSYGAE
jgi:hypothetical protein